MEDDVLMKALDSRDWISDEVLLKAIELRFSECFGAMSVANALGGSATPAWKLVRTVAPIVLLEAALSRNIALADIKGAVSKNLIVESKLFQNCCDNHPTLQQYLPAK